MLLAPLVLRRAPVRDWPIAAGVVLLGFAPYWNSLSQLLEGLLAFARHWVFNPGIWAIWRWIGERTLGDGRALADPLTALLMLGLVAWTLRRDDGSNDFLVRGTVVLLGGYVVLSATIMPWYLLWVLPLATTLDPRRAMPWLVLTGLSLLSYLIYIDQIERSWWLWVEHGTFWALVVRARLRTSSCERPARVPPGELFGISE